MVDGGVAGVIVDLSTARATSLVGGNLFLVEADRLPDGGVSVKSKIVW
jgi:hypothetical protein